jgi:hypothetical protein
MLMAPQVTRALMDQPLYFLSSNSIGGSSPCVAFVFADLADAQLSVAEYFD